MAQFQDVSAIDERLMMVSTAEKVIRGHTIEDLPFFSRLKAMSPAR